MGDIFDDLASGGVASAAPPSGSGGDVFDQLATEQHSSLFQSSESSIPDGYINQRYGQVFGKAYTASLPTPDTVDAQNFGQLGDAMTESVGRNVRQSATPEVQQKYDTYFKNEALAKLTKGDDPFKNQTRVSDEQQTQDATTQDNSFIQNYGGKLARVLSVPINSAVGIVSPKTASNMAAEQELAYAPPKPGSTGELLGNITGLGVNAVPIIASGGASGLVMSGLGVGGSRLASQQARDSGRQISGLQELEDAGLQGGIQLLAGNVLSKLGGSQTLPLNDLIQQLPAPLLKQIVGDGGKSLIPMISQLAIKAGVGAGDNEIAGVLGNIASAATGVDPNRDPGEGTLENLLSGAFLSAGHHAAENIMGKIQATKVDDHATQVASQGMRAAGVPEENVPAAAAEAIKLYKGGQGNVDLAELATKFGSKTAGASTEGDTAGVSSAVEDTPEAQQTQVQDAGTSKLPEGVLNPQAEAPQDNRLLSDMTPDEQKAELARQDELIQRADRLSGATKIPQIEHEGGRIEEGIPVEEGDNREEMDADADVPPMEAQPEEMQVPEPASKLPESVKPSQAVATPHADPKVEAARVSMEKAASEDFGGGKKVSIQVHEPSTPEEEAANTLAQGFGRKLALMTVDGDGGKIGGGAMDKHPDVIFLRKGSGRPVLDVLGHELLHSIRRVEGEGAYRKLLDVVKRTSPGSLQEGKNQYADLAPKGTVTGDRLRSNPGLHEEEGLAMVFGRAFMSRDFHAELSKSDPGLYEKVKSYVVKAVTALHAKLSGEKLTLSKEGQVELARTLQEITNAAKEPPAAEPKAEESKLPGRVLKMETTRPVSEAEKTGEAVPQKKAIADKSNEYMTTALKSGDFHPDMVKEMGGDSKEQVEAYRQKLVPQALAGDEAAQSKLATTMLPGIKSLAKKMLGPRAKGGMEDAIQTGLAEVQRFIQGSSTRQQPGESDDTYGTRKGKSPLASWDSSKGDVYSLLFNSLKSTLARHLESEYGHNISKEGEGPKEVALPTDREGRQILDQSEAGRGHTKLREDDAGRGILPNSFDELPASTKSNLVKTLSDRFGASLEKGDSEDGVKVKFASKGQEGAPSDNPDKVHGWRSPSGKKLVTYKDSSGWHYADYGAWAEGDPNWQTVRPKDETTAKFEEAWKSGKMTAPINDVAEVLNSKFDAGKVDAIYLPSKQMGADGSLEFEKHPVEERADANWIGRTMKTNLSDVTGTAASTAEAIKSMKDDLDSIFRPQMKGEKAAFAAGYIREKGAEVQQKYDRAKEALSATRKMFQKMPVPEQHDFIDKMENGLKQPTPELQNASDALRKMLDAKRDEVTSLGNGHFKTFIADYFPHIWERPGVFGALIGKRPFEGSKAFEKARKYDTMSEGLKAGLVPVSNNPVDLALLKMHEMDRYIMAHETFQEFKKQGLITFKQEAGQMPLGMKAINDNIVRRYITPPSPGAVTKVGEYVAPEQVANIFNNYLSPGLRDKPMFRGYLALGNMMNQAQLGFSAFHVLSTAVQSGTSKMALGLRYLAKGDVVEGGKHVAGSLIAPVGDFINGNKLMKAWKTGVGTPDMLQIADAMKAAGGRAGVDGFYRTDLAEKMMKKFNEGNWLGGLLRVPGAVADLASKPIMEHWVPRLKMGVFMDGAQYELANMKPNATRDDLRQTMGKLWDSVDNRMGQLVHDNLFWNKSVKDLAQASVRSTGWTFGTLREIGGGIKDVADFAKNIITGKLDKAEFTHRMAYVAAMPAFAGMIGGTLNYMLQKMHGASDEDAIPKEWGDWFFPKTGEKDRDGNDVRLALPTYMGDFLKYSNNPIETIANKTHPLLNTIVEMWRNRDYYNTKIRNEDDPLYQQAVDLLAHFGKQFEPFSSREYRKLSSDDNQTGGSQFLPLIGVIRARHDITDSPAVAMAKEFVQSQAPEGTRTSEEAQKSQERTQLIRKIRNKDPDADQAVDSAIDSGKITDRGSLRQMYNKAEHSTLWGLVEHLDMPSAMKVMNVASVNERKDLIDSLWKKLKESKTLSPEDRETYANKLDEYDR